MDAELGGKRLQLLREVIPNLARVAVLASSVSTDPFSRPFVDDMQAAATIAGIRLVPVLVNGPNDFENAFAAVTKAEAQAVIVQGLFDPYRAIILELAAKHRLPVMSGNQETTAAGGLISYRAKYLVLYEQAALYVGKIIKGANAADLPVEQPTTFEMVVNLKTARTLGLTASAALLALDAGDSGSFHSILEPTVPLSRHVFSAPTFYYKTGVVFMAYLNGHQDHFRMVGGLESGRPAVHLANIFVLADKAGLLRDAELAVDRIRPVMALAGVS